MKFIIDRKDFKDNFKLLFRSGEKRKKKEKERKKKERGFSPHPNIMKRLLCGTEQYQTSILINSHFFVPSRQ